jgi:hypothetical protein
MVYTSLAAILIAVAFIVIVIAGRLLFRGSWFLGWLKGMTGVFLVAVAIFLATAAIDFYSYNNLKSEQAIATLGFTREGSQQYKVSLVEPDGVEHLYELKGDLWQLDARILKWNNTMVTLGMSTGYRLDRLSGRYYSIEDESEAERSLYQLNPGSKQLDIWQLLHSSGNSLGFLDANYGSATYLPMADGALFAVSLSNTGLLARPLNDSARDAVKSWQ